MSGLVLKLAPRERVMINGVVMENGDRRTRLNVISAGANVLRMRDAIHPDAATTPVTRVCYIAQLALAGEAGPEEARSQMTRGIEQLRFVFCDRESRALLDRAAQAAAILNFYPALKALKQLIPQEKALFDRATGRH